MKRATACSPHLRHQFLHKWEKWQNGLYVTHLPDIEPRLQRRYEQLVKQHPATTDELAAGLRALPDTAGSFAAAQAARRFYTNPHTSLPQLRRPPLAAARKACQSDCRQFALVAHDWSEIDYSRHSGKSDRLALRPACGYQLQSPPLAQ